MQQRKLAPPVECKYTVHQLTDELANPSRMCFRATLTFFPGAQADTAEPSLGGVLCDAAVFHLLNAFYIHLIFLRD